MNSKVEQPRAASSGDIVKYALALLLVAAGIFAFYWFSEWPSSMRSLAVIGGLIFGGGVFLTSHLGVQTREFLSESRFELRKVVWPTRDETIRTTLVIIVVVIILSLLLGLIDVILKWIVLDHLLKIGR